MSVLNVSFLETKPGINYFLIFDECAPRILRLTRADVGTVKLNHDFHLIFVIEKSDPRFEKPLPVKIRPTNTRCA
jgi:hypothetical protein